MLQALHFNASSVFIPLNFKLIGIFIISLVLPISATSNDSTHLNNYELSGVILNSKNSLAVLYDNNKRKERILRVGDVIAGCVLDYIKRNGVSFYCKDQIYTLTLRGLTLELVSPDSEMLWEAPLLITPQEQSQIFDEPSNFISAFNLTPYVKDGEFAAFEVKSAPEEELSARFDLKEGDLIVGVNGVPATNAEELSDAFEQIKYTQAVDIELIRDGKRHYKTYLLNRSLVESN